LRVSTSHGSTLNRRSRRNYQHKKNTAQEEEKEEGKAGGHIKEEQKEDIHEEGFVAIPATLLSNEEDLLPKTEYTNKKAAFDNSDLRLKYFLSAEKNKHKYNNNNNNNNNNNTDGDDTQLTTEQKKRCLFIPAFITCKEVFKDNVDKKRPMFIPVYHHEITRRFYVQDYSVAIQDFSNAFKNHTPMSFKKDIRRILTHHEVFENGSKPFKLFVDWDFGSKDLPATELPTVESYFLYKTKIEEMIRTAVSRLEDFWVHYICKKSPKSSFPNKKDGGQGDDEEDYNRPEFCLTVFESSRCEYPTDPYQKDLHSWKISFHVTWHPRHVRFCSPHAVKTYLLCALSYKYMPKTTNTPTTTTTTTTNTTTRTATTNEKDADDCDDEISATEEEEFRFDYNGVADFKIHNHNIIDFGVYKDGTMRAPFNTKLDKVVPFLHGNTILQPSATFHPEVSQLPTILLHPANCNFNSNTVVSFDEKWFKRGLIQWVDSDEKLYLFVDSSTSKSLPTSKSTSNKDIHNLLNSPLGLYLPSGTTYQNNFAFANIHPNQRRAFMELNNHTTDRAMGKIRSPAKATYYNDGNALQLGGVGDEGSHSSSVLSKWELYDFIWDGIDDMLPFFDEEVARVLFSQTGCPLNGEAILHFERHKSLSMTTLMFFYKKPTPCLIKATYRSKFPEHEHNNNYVVLDLHNLTWYQGCHDAECIRKSLTIQKKQESLSQDQRMYLRETIALEDSSLSEMAKDGWISKGKSQSFAIYPSQSPLLFNSILCIWRRIREWRTRFFVNAANMSEFDGEEDDENNDINNNNMQIDNSTNDPIKKAKLEKVECVARRPTGLQPLPKKVKLTNDSLLLSCGTSSIITPITAENKLVLKKVTTTTTTTTTTTIRTTTTTSTKSLPKPKSEDTVNTLPNLDEYAAFFKSGFR
jgi:hypothetical protein